MKKKKAYARRLWVRARGYARAGEFMIADEFFNSAFLLVGSDAYVAKSGLKVLYHIFSPINVEKFATLLKKCIHLFRFQ